VAKLYTKLIPSDLLAHLEETTYQYLGPLPFYSDKTKRNAKWVHHIGYWQHYSNICYRSRCYYEKSARLWVQANYALWNLLASIFERDFPDLYVKYIRVRVPTIGAWTTVAVNMNCAVKPHKDKHDFAHGLCWVFPFGEWEGGDLLFTPENVRVRYQRGDVVAFQSFEYMHEITSYLGYRYSVVLFSDNRFFKCN
jgi:hypothetical protein